MTHSHGDHLDPETLAGYRAAGGRGPYLAPAGDGREAPQLGVPPDQILMTWPNKTCTVGRPGDPCDVRDSVQRRRPDARRLSGPRAGRAVRLFTGDTAYHELLAIWPSVRTSRISWSR